MDGITRIASASAVIVPLSTVINVGLGILVLLIAFFLLKGATRRYLRQTKDIDEAKSEFNAQNWLAKKLADAQKKQAATKPNE
jgi:flagellar biosynthesis/type III secretory pathway M-ring protein FliF/YscJ